MRRARLMTLFVCVPFAMILSAVVCLAGPQIANAQDSAAEFLQTWADAWKTSDTDKMMDFYDESDETLVIESLGNLRHGPAEIRKMYEGAFAELIFEQVTLNPICQGQHESVAWFSCRYVAELRLKADNSKYVMEVLGSFVMKKDDGAWKITSEHFSTLPDVPRIRPAGNE